MGHNSVAAGHDGDTTAGAVFSLTLSLLMTTAPDFMEVEGYI